MRVETATILLFAVATAVALIARSFKVPYTVALVLAGVSLGQFHLLQAPHLTRELLYAVFLPGLIFEASFHLRFRHVWQEKWAILLLSFPGTLVAIAVTLWLLLAVPGLPFGHAIAWPVALVFAALISATDPIAVVGLFKSLGAPERLAVIVEGESLVNDGVGVVVFTLALAFATGGTITLGQAAIDFARVVGLGVLIGAAVGFGISQVIARVDEPLIEITLTTIAAYGSFAFAEQLHESGIIATVTAGMICGSYGAPHGMSPSTRVAVESFWQYVAFALNSIVFLLIGFEVNLGQLVVAWRVIACAFLVVTAARIVVVTLGSAALRVLSERLPWRWGVMMTWAGLRGALSMVLALALPFGFAGRELVVTTTFGVVILSIVVNGLTAGPLLRRLGLASAPSIEP